MAALRRGRRDLHRHRRRHRPDLRRDVGRRRRAAPRRRDGDERGRLDRRRRRRAARAVAAVPPASTARRRSPARRATARRSPPTGARGPARPPIDFAYQWRRCDADGAGCADIAGATRSTYARPRRRRQHAARRGHGHEHRRHGTGDLGPDRVRRRRSPPSVRTAPADLRHGARRRRPSPPTRAPGTARSRIAFTYQWRRCDADGANCADIAGATSPTYTADADDVGETLRVIVTATNAGGSDAARRRQTGVVAAAAPVNQAAPTISGTRATAQTLTAAAGTWGGHGADRVRLPMAALRHGGRELRRHRRRDGAHLRADGDRRRPDPARRRDRDERRRQRRRALGADDGGRRRSPPTNTAAPTVVRHGARRLTLTAARGTWTGTPDIAYTYQWVRCDADGAGCAADRRRDRRDLRADRGGRRPRAARRRHRDERRRHAERRPPTRPPPSTPSRRPYRTAPSVDGTVRDGGTLAADPGTWDGTQPIAFAYQWRRCDAAGDACTTITGATGRTYTRDGGRRRRHAPRRRHGHQPGGADDGHLGAHRPRRRERAREHRRAARRGRPARRPDADRDPGTVDRHRADRRSRTSGAAATRPAPTARRSTARRTPPTPRRPDDVGHAVRVLVTAHNDGGTQTARVRPDRGRRRAGAAEHRDAGRLRAGRRRRDADRRRRRLDRHARHHLHLPVGALRRAGRRVRGDHGRDGPDLRPERRGDRPHAPGRRHRAQRRRHRHRHLGDDRAGRPGGAAHERRPDRHRRRPRGRDAHRRRRHVDRHAADHARVSSGSAAMGTCADIPGATARRTTRSPRTSGPPSASS